MKKIFTSLPFKLVVGVVLGIIAGQLAGIESVKNVGDAVMNLVVTVRYILAEIINFCVPLIVIGFIAPSITRLGKNASRMLGVALFCAYMIRQFPASLVVPVLPPSTVMPSGAVWRPLQ